MRRLDLGQAGFAHFGLAEEHDLLGFGGIGDHLEIVAGFGQRLQTEHLDGRGRLGFADLLAAIVQHGAHFAEHGAADEIIAHVQRAVAHQHGGHRSAAAIELGFEHVAHGRTGGIGFEILQIGHQQNHLEQQIEVDLHLGGDGHHHRIAAPVFGQQAAIGELLLDALGLRVGLVDLVNGDDDGDLGGAGVVDGFEGLRHDAVVGRHHQHHDIGDFGAAGAHAGERFVAGRIDEHNLAAVFFDVICADVLGDAAGLFAGHIGFADGIQQRSLAVIDVAHDGDHGRALEQILLLFGNLHLLLRFFFVGDGGGGGAKLARDFGGELGIERLVDGGEDVAIDQLLDDQAGLDVQLFGKLFDGDAFGNGDLAADRRRTGLGLAAGGRPQNFLFRLEAAIALGTAAALIAGAALLIGRRGRDRGFHAGTARGRMHGARAAGAHGSAGAEAGSGTLAGHGGLAGTERSAIDGLSGRGCALRAGNAGAGRDGWARA